MTVVSNTSPLCYLALIGHADILPKLYGSVHITQKVLEELRHPHAPPSVRLWAATPPDWLQIHSDPQEPDLTLSALDSGERTAMRLSEELRSEVVLLDESAARALASQRGRRASGTLGVLCDAAQAGLLKLPAALDLLRKTNFRAAPELWKSLYTRRMDWQAR
jgi:predicted nucleic acid-binding protein